MEGAQYAARGLAAGSKGPLISAGDGNYQTHVTDGHTESGLKDVVLGVEEWQRDADA